LVSVAQTALDIGELVEGVGLLAVARILADHLGKGLAGIVQIALRQIYLAQPILSITRIIALRIATQEGVERHFGLLEITQAHLFKGGFIEQLLALRIGFCRRRVAGLSLGGRRRCAGGKCGQSRINILLAIKLIRFHLLEAILLLFEQATQHGYFLRHLIQLKQKLGRCREASRGRTGIRQTRSLLLRIIAGVTRPFHHRYLSQSRDRQQQTTQRESLIPFHVTSYCLLAQFNATVLSPCFFGGANNSRLLFTVGDQLELGRGHALQNQVALNGSGTTLAQSHVVLTGATLVGVTFQNNAVALSFQVLGVNVQSAHGFRLQVGAVELEVEGGDGAQSGFFAAQATVSTGGSASAVTGVRVYRAGTGSVTTLGGTTNHNAESDNQSCQFAELDNFHHRLLIN